ncbi:SA1362 family protein [Virgibacillus sp. DJP39]|uniref:SA1362 family protein n=1 Tax=Virgibacillus sp. DJP39 TaxID=3409790 RepID=UPI003BB4ACCA
MLRNKFSVFIYAVLGLATIGLLTQLFTNTVNFLTSIMIMLGIGLAIFALVYVFFFKRRSTSNDMKKYKNAVRQSKSKYTPNNTVSDSATKKQSLLIKRKPSKRASHLRVIDGNKHKRKNRATF